MTKIASLLFWLGAAVNEAQGFNIPKGSAHRGDVNPVKQQLSKRGYVGLEFTKSYGDTFEDASSENKPELYLHKRNDGYESIEITNQATFYSVSLEIGTPEQNITVLVDTGSSDLWVSNSDNPYCQSNYQSSTGISYTDTIDCDEYGTFDPDSSSSWSSNDTSFNIKYGDSTFASGVWGQDRLHLEDLNVTGLSFAVANRSNSTVGVLGIGLPGLEVTYTGSASTAYQYDNFPMVLKRSGAIESNVYSLYLNELDATHGTVLFGAVDHSKYEAPLYTIPLINTLRANGFSSAVQFDVTLQGLGMTFDNGTSDKTLTTTAIPALLDSGTTLTYLPSSLVEIIANQIGASYSSRLGYYTVACPDSSSSSSSTLDGVNLVFDFGGFYINSTLENFLVQASATTCLLGIVPQTAHSALLGDSFLSNAYVVYDLENKEISMAQAKYDVDSSDIEVVSSGASSIPSATKAPGYSQTWSSSVASIGTTGDIFTLQAQATVGNSGSETASATSNGNDSDDNNSSSGRSTSRTSSGSRTSARSSSSGTSTGRTTTSSTNRRNGAFKADILNPMSILSIIAFYLTMML
ncbi:similar to Saccharomyces cerevisiae YDR144C MKC7 GPI-anchored aspartyl protease, member of the yapsin family of proteases involved in cell wall growth and maintenance [Maudiozyma saulgeensis]|uniref:Similar to Saccharomyces cerevisiae YDR144C MKC7 GPI-anchored aspartyl protease, member of the yapsin family of proteases involved in cell wall growth and maintenance n=1 Tax=Maudiozyma saulgeensis TaxID=1789683 RepID=A0A1X7R4W3_9SACH|nr:similar to Saccharomyces cerevisiae YDR144C MKC7 GPI-anchored aspartyl protease, member of the yapsin family of proteases involved in cell wall growth and maintenance [Kazachstania saulgeensis]